MFSLPEPLGIDPRVDLVFAWLFGDPDHEAFLLDFLNAVLAGDGPTITRATVKNPIHPGSFEGDREMRVDIEVVDEVGCTYQIEMQRQARRGLEQRMLYGWARLYAGQPREEPSYRRLRPVVAIWVCDEDAFPDAAGAHLRFRVREVAEELPLHSDFRIEVLQLARVSATGTGLPDVNLGRWARFLNEVAGWRALPEEVYTPTLENAMRAMNTFRTDSELNAIYQARHNFQMEFSAEIKEIAELKNVRAALEESRGALEESRGALEESRLATEAERAAKEAALAELAQLRGELAQTRG